MQHRPVEIGARRDGRVVIEQGLAAGERVIVNGIQRARPGGRVEAHAVEAHAAEANAAEVPANERLGAERSSAEPESLAPAGE
ncbi:MAG: hypothetical protein HOP15_15995 [Planctomycetes bacterium]|nr:hypothetical protein [Planctomycetota bacterium]